MKQSLTQKFVAVFEVSISGSVPAQGTSVLVYALKVSFKLPRFINFSENANTTEIAQPQQAVPNARQNLCSDRRPTSVRKSHMPRSEEAAAALLCGVGNERGINEGCLGVPKRNSVTSKDNEKGLDRLRK